LKARNIGLLKSHIVHLKQMINAFQILNAKPKADQPKQQHPKATTSGLDTLQNNIQEKRDRLAELQNNRIVIEPDHSEEIKDNLEELERTIDDLSSNFKRKLSITDTPLPIEPLQPIPKLQKSKPRVSRKAVVKR
jgi:vacuolar-type H+-ATPase subunit I/STV1